MFRKKTLSGEITPNESIEQRIMNAEKTNFEKYQEHVEKTDQTRGSDVPLYGLVGEVGEILTAFKKQKREYFPGFRDELKEELGDALWYLTALALKNGMSLEQIAAENVKKSTSLFDEGEVRRFDAIYPENERFPRSFEIQFVVTGGVVKMMLLGGKKPKALGNPIKDNNYVDDFYRHHDVFHLAYAAVLGWSPVIRRMLEKKRKSKPEVDEVEDGGRAAIIEEAISAFVFNHASTRGYYKDTSKMHIDSRMMKIIMQMVSHLEVKVCTAKEWKNAIQLGFKIFHQVKDDSSGKLLVDLDGRDITYIK